MRAMILAVMAVVLLAGSCKTAATNYQENTIHVGGSKNLTLPEDFVYLGEIKNFKNFADTGFNRTLLKGNFKIAMHVYVKGNGPQSKEADEVVIINSVNPVSPNWVLLCYNINDQEYLSDQLAPGDGSVGGFIHGKGYDTNGTYAFVMRKVSCNQKKLFRILYGVDRGIQNDWKTTNKDPQKNLSERVSELLR